MIIADDDAAGGRLLSYNFFEDDSRSMFHELLCTHRRGLRPPRVLRKPRSPRSIRLLGFPLSRGKLKISRDSQRYCDISNVYVGPLCVRRKKDLSVRRHILFDNHFYNAIEREIAVKDLYCYISNLKRQLY